MKSFIFILTTLSSLGSIINFVNSATDSYLNTYGECNSIPSSEEESQTFCNAIFTSEKCQNYYNNPDKVLNADYDELDIVTIHYHREKAKAVCQADETNKRCPVGQYYIDISTDTSVNENDYILNACHSKVCTEVTNSYVAAKEKYYNLKYPNKIESFSENFKLQYELLTCTDTNAIKNINDKTNEINTSPNVNNKVGTTSNPNSGIAGSNDKIQNNFDSSTNSVSDGGVTNGNIINNNSNENENSSNNKDINVEQSNFGESISYDKKIALLVGFILFNIFFL
ncbi:hypothetical protein BCR36DRAFT_62311 [Piromyces finnis]|uniref:Uncharacterized protein n=1 Tax=Piromyces finnis TaxID=1754191 RepID=A0A1Y1V8N8_9FUNG|nr:hypothetical protein BCR36DRAFT_62311 [Piromyces finnis]|eukprot:ORX49965.1 hypothetical protein BCR36DRAFT_62311 [Piromyces finnis]